MRGNFGYPARHYKLRRAANGRFWRGLAFFVGATPHLMGEHIISIKSHAQCTATDSQFDHQERGTGGLGPLGGLLPRQFANSADSIATQSYLAVQRRHCCAMDATSGYYEHFLIRDWTRFQRMHPDCSNEEPIK